MDTKVIVGFSPMELECYLEYTENPPLVKNGPRFKAYRRAREKLRKAHYEWNEYCKEKASIGQMGPTP